MTKQIKKIGFVSNAAFGIKTGFQRNIAALLSYLYKTRKDIEIFHLVQSFHENDPKLKLAPWKCQGVFSDEIINTERFQKDQNYQRFVSYGNVSVEDFVIKNELDGLIFIEDIWGAAHDAYHKKDWFRFAKENSVIWTTLDSLPILPDALEWASKTPNFWVWSDFAEREMKKIDSEKFSHVKTVYGTLNCDEFRPISTQEKQALRNKFNINQNDIIINMTSRNQLRKLFHVNIEALAKYKKNHQGKNKVRLLFHTSWTEGAGWPIERIRNEFGLDKGDILTTYFCQKCGNWAIMPFEAEPMTCPFCKSEHAFITAGVTSKVSNEDLSKIYGICDAMSHQMTSGGLEYALVEGLLCGLPVTTNGYSCGETFTKQSFVESTDFTLTRECGTAFYKAVPNPNNVAKFFKKIAEMDPAKRLEIGRSGREWALKTFHVDIIGKKVETFIDSIQALDWSKYHEHKKNYDIKHPDAEINIDIDSDVEFVKSLYKNILNMDVTDDDSGLQSWMINFHQLSQSDSEQKKIVRKNIEMSFRKIAAQENAKNSGVSFESLIDKERKNKRLLFAIKESAGDILICTGLLKDLKKKYGGDTDIYFMTQEKYFDIIQGNEYIHKIIPWFEPMAQEMIAIGAGKPTIEKPFDYFIFPATSTQKFLSYLSQEKAGNIV